MSNSSEDTVPGDEVPPGKPSSGENLCPECGGSGTVEGRQCPECEGRGTVITAVGGG